MENKTEWKISRFDIVINKALLKKFIVKNNKKLLKKLKGLYPLFLYSSYLSFGHYNKDYIEKFKKELKGFQKTILANSRIFNFETYTMDDLVCHLNSAEKQRFLEFEEVDILKISS